jgi:protein gp37
MPYPTPIEWTDATWNPIGGCSIKSPGCAPCYAQKLAGTRLKHHPLYEGTTDVVKGKPVFNGHLTMLPDGHPTWTWPLRWRGAKFPVLSRADPCPPPEAALPYGSDWPSLIFVGDMSDLFHENRPIATIDAVVGICSVSNHISQLLTKRADVMAGYFAHSDVEQNIWLGFSAERQKEFDERWPHMRNLADAGWTIFLSYEPAIGPLKLPQDFLTLGRRAQVIAGGMSGDDADRPPHPDWFRSVRDQCASADVPFLFKQWGEWAPREIAIQIYDPDYDQDNEVEMARVGKKAAGRQLDGVEHNGFPEVRG